MKKLSIFLLLSAAVILRELYDLKAADYACRFRGGKRIHDKSFEKYLDSMIRVDESLEVDFYKPALKKAVLSVLNSVDDTTACLFKDVLLNFLDHLDVSDYVASYSAEGLFTSTDEMVVGIHYQTLTNADSASIVLMHELSHALTARLFTAGLNASLMNITQFTEEVTEARRVLIADETTLPADLLARRRRLDEFFEASMARGEAPNVLQYHYSLSHVEKFFSRLIHMLFWTGIPHVPLPDIHNESLFLIRADDDTISFTRTRYPLTSASWREDVARYVQEMLAQIESYDAMNEDEIIPRINGMALPLEVWRDLLPGYAERYASLISNAAEVLHCPPPPRIS